MSESLSTPIETRPAVPAPERIRRLRNDAEAIEAAQRLAPLFARGASERDRERLLPWEELALWSESGLGGITVPRAHGGAEVSHATLAEVFLILSEADPALGQIPQNHFRLLGVLREIGSEAQKKRLYGEVLAGRRLGNAGPERRSKTLLHGQTRLRSTPAGLRLSGERFYSTGALFAHRVPTRALDDEGRAVQVWVPRDAPGLRVIDDWRSFVQRTTASGTVRFDDVAIEADDVLPIWQLADRPGLYGPVSQLVQAAIDQGIAQAALVDALAFVRERCRARRQVRVRPRARRHHGSRAPYRSDLRRARHAAAPRRASVRHGTSRGRDGAARRCDATGGPGQLSRCRPCRAGRTVARPPVRRPSEPGRAGRLSTSAGAPGTVGGCVRWRSTSIPGRQRAPG